MSSSEKLEYFSSTQRADPITHHWQSGINIAGNVIINVCDTNASVLISLFHCAHRCNPYSPIAIAIC